MQPFSEIINLNVKLPLPEKNGLIARQNSLLSDTSFGVTFEK